ncbi:MAG: GNAT family N-acetyltransferase [Thermoplasmata archaeon]|nr:GNAT family N-acetyltransferase [Thermoplasmata archaeon]
MTLETRTEAKIRRIQEKDYDEAGRFCKKTLNWMWGKYLKDVYPKEANEFHISNWAPKNLAVRFSDPNKFGFVAVERGSICGILLGTRYGKSGFAAISWIAVDPEHQHEGIGIKLMSAAEEALKKEGCHKLSLNTLPALTPAVRLAMKFGMLPEAHLRQQWWGADFVLMSKWIGKYKKRA